jgi:hypothetical protein
MKFLMKDFINVVIINNMYVVIINNMYEPIGKI